MSDNDHTVSEFDYKLEFHEENESCSTHEFDRLLAVEYSKTSVWDFPAKTSLSVNK